MGGEWGKQAHIIRRILWVSFTQFYTEERLFWESSDTYFAFSFQVRVFVCVCTLVSVLVFKMKLQYTYLKHTSVMAIDKNHFLHPTWSILPEQSVHHSAVQFHSVPFSDHQPWGNKVVHQPLHNGLQPAQQTVNTQSTQTVNTRVSCCYLGATLSHCWHPIDEHHFNVLIVTQSVIKKVNCKNTNYTTWYLQCIR